jgi:four helix bundle protein
MKDIRDNIIATKSMAFAIRVVKLNKYLQEERRGYCISKQLFRSGTSVGANVREALRGQSLADFRPKRNITLKEASESEYWIELLREGHYISDEATHSLHTDRIELIKLLTSIVKSVQKNST